MNKKLILLLSLFGLALGFVTVFAVPAIAVRLCWMTIFIVSPYLLAKYGKGKYFLHGFLLGLINAAWITAAHLLLFDIYIANHQHETEMASTIAALFKIPAGSIVIVMLVRGIIVGLISGLVLGLFAFIVSRIMKRK